MAAPVSKGLQDIGPGPRTEKPPTGGSATGDETAVLRRARRRGSASIPGAERSRCQRAGAKLTLTEYMWGLFEAQQRDARAEAPASCPSFLDLAPMAAALTDLADEDNRLRSEIGKCERRLLQTFGMHADDGPAMRAAIGAALNEVAAAIGAADAACAARDDALAALQKR